MYVGGLSAALLLLGCSVRTGDLNLISTKNVASLESADSLGTFEGSDCRAVAPPSLEEAIDRAIEQGNGNAMTNAAVYLTTAPFHNCFRVRGDVVKLKGGN